MPNFQEIATATNGTAAFLDVNSSAGAEHLTDRVTETVLQNVGGDEQGEALVEAYRAKYTR